MDIESIISKLEQEWDLEFGFLGRLRGGDFDPASLERLLGVLDDIDFNQGTLISRRMVSLLWFMPLFMEWQKERVEEAGGSLTELKNAATRVQNAAMRILGVP